MIQTLKAPAPAAPLFGGWPECMLRSCLTGTMGTVLANEAVSAAAAVLGDFAFFAGVPDWTLLDAAAVPLLVPQNDDWAAAITARFGRSVQPITRYATRKDTVFDRTALERYVRILPNSYTIRIINHELYDLCSENGWSRDLVSQYPTWEAYRTLGLGFAVLQNGILLAGASSYASFPGGIEIEIDTRLDARRRGLARAAGAALILACLDQGLYPSWDAHDTVSLSLAEQLGYQPDGPYRAFLRQEL